MRDQNASLMLCVEGECMVTPNTVNRTFEAVIYPNGQVQLLGQVSVSVARRALVTILDEPPLEFPTT
ncbi:MAG: hypothetical protein KDA84_11185, partial [Planctomycetaceae bacterium]|nr:hypothetical protein [Planctomycetaceae bacterium]